MRASFNARAAGLEMSAATTIDVAARAGFDAVDLLVRDLLEAGEDPRRLRQQMDDLGLHGGAFPMPVTWRGDADRFAQDLAALPRLAEAAATLGLLRTGTWVMPETPAELGAGALALTTTRRLHVDRLGAIARVLEPFRIQLGIEVLGVASMRSGRGRPFVTRMGALEDVLGPPQAIGPNVGVVVDGWHLHAAGETVEAALCWGIERIVWVHIADLRAGAAADREAMNDQERGLPGENGAIDSHALLERLGGEGYRGPVTAEPMAGSPALEGLDGETAAHAIAAALRSVWPRLATPE
jgi:sugar phosphate isomerase/epimerase